MTDKEKIKEEIERRFDDNMKASEQYTENSKSRALFTSAAKEDYDLLAFIDSLPKENHFEDKSEMVNEGLEEEILCRWEDDPHTLWPKCPYSDFKNIAHHFAEWQKKKDQETIELAEDHAMLAGMNKMKEEMMKDAIESIVEDWCGDSPEVTIPLNPQDFKTGDKLKILILKTE